MNKHLETKLKDFTLKYAEKSDIPAILSFIKGMAEYEKLEDQFAATEELLEIHLFGNDQAAEVILGFHNNKPVSMALFFKSFSTFLSRPGLYLEDLFVIPEMRGRGFGKIMLSYLAKLTKENNYGRLEWSVLDWNKPAVEFYNSIGAEPMKGWTVQRMSGQALNELSEHFWGIKMSIILKETKESDLSFVTEAESDPANSPYVDQWSFSRHRDSLMENDIRHMIIFDDITKSQVGYVIMAGFSSVHKSIELKRLVVAEKGKGYGQQVLNLIKKLVFGDLACHRLWLDVRDHNARAIKLYEKNGFKIEGHLKECVYVKDHYESIYIMAILA